MSGKRTTGRKVVSDVPGQAHIFTNPPEPRLVHPPEKIVQPLGDCHVENLDVSQWDEVSAVPLPCGVSLIVARRGSNLRVGATSLGARTPCSPADLDALTNRVDSLSAQMAAFHLAGKTRDSNLVRCAKGLDQLSSIVQGLDYDLSQHVGAVAGVGCDQGMGLEKDRVDQSLPHAGEQRSTTACDDQVRAEVRPEGATE